MSDKNNEKKDILLDDLFSHLKKMAQERELEEPDDSSFAPSMSQESNNSIEPTCSCKDEEGYFVAKDKSGYLVCPACNPRPSCRKCNGTGHLTKFDLVLRIDTLLPFGCECTRLEKSVARLNQARIPQRYLEADFADFEATDSKGKPALSPKAIENQKAAREFCDKRSQKLEHDERKFFLTMMGPPGSGKTHLGIAALKHLVFEHGYTGVFIDFQNLLYQLRDSISKSKETEEILRPLREADVLLIDELGKGRSRNEWQLETLDELINTRYNSRKLTILTTNYLPMDLQRVWIASLPAKERQMYLKESPRDSLKRSYDAQKFADQADNTELAPANESFWSDSLQERIGIRMYDRIVEVSEFIDFIGVPSYRQRAAINFLKKYQAFVNSVQK